MTEPIRVWFFRDAPEELRKLSQHGGDEDWLALVPSELAEEWIGWLQSGAFDSMHEPSRHVQPDGSVVYIGAHS